MEQTSFATEDPAAGTHGQALQLPHEGLQARLLTKELELSVDTKVYKKME